MNEESKVDFWNRNNEIGTLVDVKDDFGDVARTTTSSEAWVLCGTAVVSLEDRRGGYMLDRCRPVEE